MTEPVAGRVASGVRTGAPRVAEIVRMFLPALRERHALSARQEIIVERIARCQTAAMGGHVLECSGCGDRIPMYNSCRDRHCPQCQWGNQLRWMEAREERILPVPYFHTVFTIPEQLKPLVAANPSKLYALLFDAVATTLKTCANDPKRLGAMPGFTLVLHTWDRTLRFHPHIHGVITAGGLTTNGQWKGTNRPGRKSFLFPVKVMGALFKKAFLTSLIELLWAGELSVPDTIAHNVLERVRAAARASWVVYAKRPFAGAQQVYRYLAMYTHRVGISNSRIIAIDGDHVRFHTRGNKAVRISGIDFVHRFTLHILPKGFTRLRHYGLLAPAHVNTTWNEANKQLAPAAAPAPNDDSATTPSNDTETADNEQALNPSESWHPPICRRCQCVLPHRSRDPPRDIEDTS